MCSHCCVGDRKRGWPGERRWTQTLGSRVLVVDRLPVRPLFGENETPSTSYTKTLPLCWKFGFLLSASLRREYQGRHFRPSCLKRLHGLLSRGSGQSIE